MEVYCVLTFRKHFPCKCFLSMIVSVLLRSIFILIPCLCRSYAPYELIVLLSVASRLIYILINGMYCFNCARILFIMEFAAIEVRIDRKADTKEMACPWGAVLDFYLVNPCNDAHRRASFICLNVLKGLGVLFAYRFVIRHLQFWFRPCASVLHGW